MREPLKDPLVKLTFTTHVDGIENLTHFSPQIFKTMKINIFIRQPLEGSTLLKSRKCFTNVATILPLKLRFSS